MSSKIPVIDISPLYCDDICAKRNVGRQIDAACRSSGFFQVSNHGCEKYLTSLTQETFSFFKTLSMEQKMSLARRKYNPNNKHIYRGYFPSAVNGKEGFDIGNPTIDNKPEINSLPNKFTF